MSEEDEKRNGERVKRGGTAEDEEGRGQQRMKRI